jgi:ubiquinone/menaquinone biosynthesis C-methylase UbiE
MQGYDPTIFLGTAGYYRRGRPPYSAELPRVLCDELGLDGRGHLVDVGCGPGILSTMLAPYFERVTAIDPDGEMLAEGERYARSLGLSGIEWVQARAEDLADLGLEGARLVTFGQSLHWTDRERVLEMVYDLLAPGGAVAVISHNPPHREAPAGPGHPRIPHAEIRALIAKYLGPQRRAGQGFAPFSDEYFQDNVANTRFGAPRIVYAPGREDLVQGPDELLANFLSTSFAATHLFGERFDDFVADFYALLAEHTDTGKFWDWPGDTELILGRKP